MVKMKLLQKYKMIRCIPSAPLSRTLIIMNCNIVGQMQTMSRTLITLLFFGPSHQPPCNIYYNVLSRFISTHVRGLLESELSDELDDDKSSFGESDNFVKMDLLFLGNVIRTSFIL